MLIAAVVPLLMCVVRDLEGGGELASVAASGVVGCVVEVFAVVVIAVICAVVFEL